MRVDFQPEAVHADRAADAVLAIQGVASGHNMQDFAIVRDGDIARHAHGFFEILGLDAARAHNRGQPAARQRRDMAAGDADKGAVDVVAARLFRLADRLGDGGRQSADVIDHALLHAVARLYAQADDINVFRAHFAYNRADLMRAYVESNYQVAHAVL